MSWPAGESQAIAGLARSFATLEAEYRALIAGRWYSQPLPRRWHRCTPAQSATWDGTDADRCACGGIRLDGGRWMERNSRRRAGRCACL